MPGRVVEEQCGFYGAGGDHTQGSPSQSICSKKAGIILRIGLLCRIAQHAGPTGGGSAQGDVAREENRHKITANGTSSRKKWSTYLVVLFPPSSTAFCWIVPSGPRGKFSFELTGLAWLFSPSSLTRGSSGSDRLGDVTLTARPVFVSSINH